MKTSGLLLGILLLLPLALAECDDSLTFVGWYVFDDHTEYETVSNPGFVVGEHGDTDLYYYEPSGGRGLMDPSMDDATAFSAIEDYIRDNVAEGSLQNTFSYETTSTLATFQKATYTYALAYLMIPEGYSGTFKLKVTKVDDGISLLVNARHVGFLKLNDGSKEFDLNVDSQGSPGVLHAGKNTIIIILADDSKREKYVRGLQFTYNGQAVVAALQNTIAGYVRDSNGALAGATVSTSAGSDVTDSTGFYSIGCLPDGTYAVTASKECYNPKTAQVSVSGNKVKNQDFVLIADSSCQSQPPAQPAQPSGCCEELRARVAQLEARGIDGTALAALILAILALVAALMGNTLMAALKKNA